jgi:hypothetical protein
LRRGSATRRGAGSRISGLAPNSAIPSDGVVSDLTTGDSGLCPMLPWRSGTFYDFARRHPASDASISVAKHFSGLVPR